jgi:hypothetical protein
VTIVAVCTAPGTVGATTTTLLLAAMAPAGAGMLVAECDPSGGDLGAWAQLPTEPGWSTAIAEPARSWAVIARHSQALPNGLRVMTAPTRSSSARPVIGRAAAAFAPLLAAATDAFVIADCGRVDGSAPVWVGQSQLALLLVRQASSAAATVARVDRAIEALDVLGAVCPNVGVALVGRSPYAPAEVEAALGMELFATLPEDAPGASLVAGGWTLGRGAAKSPLARAIAPVARRAVDLLVAAPTGASAR